MNTLSIGKIKNFIFKLLYFFLVVIIFIRPSAAIYQQRETFFTGGYSGRFETFSKLYYSSQYVKKENPNIIPDGTLESFAAGVFLKGLNPILIVHDQPPLGRYLIALSIFLFDNSDVVLIPLMTASIAGIFLIGKKILRNTLAALVPVAVFVNEPLFLSKFNYGPLLEPIQLPFIIFSLYFFVRGIEEKHHWLWFILTSLMLGFVISIRFFILGAGLVLAMLLFFLWQKTFNKKLILFLLSLPLSLVILILSYLKTLQAGYSVFQIFGIQKYILFYHQSKFILPFSFWDLVLFNRWHTWWGERSISSDSEWIIFWPISFFLTAAFLIFALRKKLVLNNTEKILFLWVGVLSLMLSTGYTSTRYFLPLVPFLYILAVSFLIKIFTRLNKK